MTSLIYWKPIIRGFVKKNQELDKGFFRGNWNWCLREKIGRLNISFKKKSRDQKTVLPNYIIT